MEDKVTTAFFVEQADSLHKSNVRFLRDARVRPGMTIAEIGTGFGTFTLEIANKVWPSGRVISFDIRKSRLQTALQRTKGQRCGKTIDFLLADANWLPFRPGVIDGFLCCLTLYQIPNTLGILRKVNALLKPGGLIGASCEPDYLSAFSTPLPSKQTGKMSKRALMSYIARGWQVTFARKLPLLLSEAGFSETRMMLALSGEDVIAGTVAYLRSLLKLVLARDGPDDVAAYYEKVLSEAEQNRFVAYTPVFSVWAFKKSGRSSIA